MTLSWMNCDLPPYKNEKKKLLIHSLYIFNFFIVCQAGPHQRRLIYHLLDPYNIMERPVAKESEPIRLSLGLSLQQILDVVSGSGVSFIAVRRLQCCIYQMNFILK